MTTLIINDLPTIEELDHKEMAAVQGGERKSMVQVANETAQMLQEIASGKCEFSETGKSYVCY